MGTLFECLREARLEKYYPSFRAHGITRSEGLARLTSQDCAVFGITSAEDKRRLIELIKIVKSVHNTESFYADSSTGLRSAGQHSRNKSPRKRNRSPAYGGLQNVQITGRALSASNDVRVHERPVRTNSSCHQLSQAGAALLDLLSDSDDTATSDSADHSDYEPATKHSVTASAQMSPPRVRKTPIERVKQHGKGYNYGVPGSTSSSFSKSKSRPGRHPRDEKIKVCVRKRPLSKKEARTEEDIVKAESTTTLTVLEPKQAVDLTAYTLEHEFIFDEVFDEKCDNEDVYIRAARPLISCVFDGGSATCFAYGQTGAGKTHTMIGNNEVPGLYLLAGHDIFSIIESGQYGTGIKVWLSYFEIYCGQLFDLLNKRSRLHAREDGSHRVCIAGLIETEVKDVTALMQVLEYGNQVRSKGSTGVNADSSRSHAILQMEIRDARDKRLGKVSFIDLAGSERASDVTDTDKQTRMEGAEINQSLLALKECIRSIDQESRHKPFRQSKLTHILKDSFVGNSRTCMIANISPNHSSCEHTLNTLRYADRVKEIRRSVAAASSGSGRSNVAMSNILMNIPPTGPSMFQPSNILCSSTPMKPASRQFTNRASSAEVQLDPCETPIRGPGAKRKTASAGAARPLTQRSSVASSVQSRASMIRHVAARQNDSSHSESDHTDTDSCNVTGPQNLPKKPANNQNIPTVKSTDTDNDFPTTDFNNEEEMNDLNRTGGKQGGLSQFQAVTASVPNFPGTSAPNRVPVATAQSVSASQFPHISSVSASTPVLRQKTYTDSSTSSTAIPPVTAQSSFYSSQGLEAQTRASAAYGNSQLSENSGFSQKPATQQRTTSDQYSRGFTHPNTKDMVSSVPSGTAASTLPGAAGSKEPKVSESSPSHRPAPIRLPSVLNESLDDDLLYITPSLERRDSDRQNTPRDLTGTFLSPPTSARTQPKVPQTLSSDPVIPAVLPAKSSDLTTFSQRSSPGRVQTTRNQNPASSGFVLPNNVSKPSNSHTNIESNAFSAGLANTGKISQGLTNIGRSLSDPDSEFAFTRNIGNKHFKTDTNHEQIPERSERDKSKPVISDRIDSGSAYFPTSLSIDPTNIPSTNAQNDLTPSSQQVSVQRSGSGPISANWFSTPADHDTHVAASVSAKGSCNLAVQKEKSDKDRKGEQKTVSEDEKEFDTELPDFIPIQKPTSHGGSNYNDMKSVHSDSGIVSTSALSGDRSGDNRFQTGSNTNIRETKLQTGSSYFPTSASESALSNNNKISVNQTKFSSQLNGYTEDDIKDDRELGIGARPKYSSTYNTKMTSQETRHDSHSPVVLQETADHRSNGHNGTNAIKTEKLQVGSMFSPIHPQPVTNGRSIKSSSAVSKDIVHPTPVSKSSVTVDGRQEHDRSQTSSEGEHADFQVQLISAHEDQLASVTSLCKQEMKLLLGAKAGNKTFDDYLKRVNDVLSQKMAAIQLLQDQIIAYQISTQNDSV